MIFPLAYLALTSSLTAILIAAGLAGRAELAAELAVIQGALLATFYAFSANTRNLILQGHGELTPERLLAQRFVALPLMGAAAYLLCVGVVGVSPVLALIVIARRSCEWLAEVRLCELEVAAAHAAARRVFGIQVALTVAAALLVALTPELTLPALVVLAVGPLLGAPPRPSLAAFRPSALGVTLRGASPYIGSTTVDGVSTYVLRLVVFLVAGPERAGLLFTAFVLGSFAATLFANVLGPTLALSRARNAAAHGSLVASAAAAMALGGIAVAGGSLASGVADWLGRPGYFWLALGLSLVGAAIMVGAQWIRLGLFDERRGELLFGPDVLRTITAIIAVPSLYYLLGPAALGALYLLTALLTAFVYWGAAVRQQLADVSPLALRVLAAAILLPLFFTLEGRIYHSPGAALLDPGPSVLGVPLPLALPACFAALLLLARYRQATLTLGTIFLLFIAMVLTTVFAAQGQVSDELRKYVMLFQYLVPVFALALGEMCGASRAGMRNVALGFGAVLSILVPAQLLQSLSQDAGLRHDLWFFSVYQHLQYVPVVLGCAFWFALFTLWEENERVRRLQVVLGALVAYYAASSGAMLAVALIAVGAMVFLAWRPRDAAARVCAALMLAALAVPLYASDSLPSIEGAIQQRLYYWRLYGNGIFESARSALFGHPDVMDRSLAPSAYNYYLDFVYNFGLIAFLPFAWLLVHTASALWRNRALFRQDPALIGLALPLGFAVLLDNMFKVPFRQPYSGIVLFFLWGMLLARVRRRAE